MASERDRKDAAPLVADRHLADAIRGGMSVWSDSAPVATPHLRAPAQAKSARVHEVAECVAVCAAMRVALALAD